MAPRDSGRVWPRDSKSCRIICRPPCARFREDLHRLGEPDAAGAFVIYLQDAMAREKEDTAVVYFRLVLALHEFEAGYWFSDEDRETFLRDFGGGFVSDSTPDAEI